MQFWKAKRPQSMLNSWGYSSMGFGVCGVLGAQLAAPDRPCVAVVGDGGFTMAPYVLCTAVEYNLPVRLDHLEQLRVGRDPRPAVRPVRRPRDRHRVLQGRDRASRYNPDFAAWARACGADGVTVTRPRGPRRRGRAGAEEPPPCVIDVHVDANVRPPSTGTWQLPPIPYKEPVYGKPFVA